MIVVRVTDAQAVRLYFPAGTDETRARAIMRSLTQGCTEYRANGEWEGQHERVTVVEYLISGDVERVAVECAIAAALTSFLRDNPKEQAALAAWYRHGTTKTITATRKD